MRSRADRVTRAAALLLLIACTPAARLDAQPARPGARPSAAEITRALDRVKADPNVSGVQKIQTLRWRRSGQQAEPPGWLRWVGGLVRWFAESARLLMWTAVIALVGLLAFYVVRLVHGQQAAAARIGFIAPTHVRSLDIRPESLPSDIGRAARALWDRGEHRPALSLLYRGLLSRLAHVHHVPIRDSSTEGDCLALAAHHVGGDRHSYASRLVRAWQQATYGGEAIETVAVYALCDQFAAAMDPPASGPGAAGHVAMGQPA